MKIYLIYKFIKYINWECPRGVMVKAMDLRNRSKRVRTPVALLCSL